MNKVEFTLDRLTRYLLIAIAMLLAVIAVELWSGRPSMLPAARAQIPDSGSQRFALLEEARRTNDLLSQILDHLRTKPMKVRMEGTDDPDKARRRPGDGGRRR